MDYSLVDLLKLVGAVGLFLYGMKLMSEALQKVAGSKMRSIFAAMTKNRFLGVLTGLLISATIQSSSATILMVVSFVNAGLVSLAESIGVIMGANVGTTITGWLISLFGFRFNFTEYALPLMAVGFPLVFSKVQRHKSWGEAIIGFSILFVSLDFIKTTFPDINTNPEILRFLSDYTNLGFTSVLLFVFIGSFLTLIVQSSGATMAITFVMCNQGWIPYELGAAMILGENLGTTITPNIAATIGNISAKRTARAHLFFNILGVIWMLIFFKPYTAFIEQFIANFNAVSVKNPQALIPFALALFHTSFNIINLLLFIGFVPLMHRAIIELVPHKGEEGEEFKLRYITTGRLSTSELSIIQAKKELQSFARHTNKMLGFNQTLLHESNEKKFSRLYANIEKYESISDDVEVEIANYLAMVSQGKLSELSRRRIRAMLKLVSDLESIGDSSYTLARIINRMHKTKIKFPPTVLDKLDLMFSLVENALNTMKHNLNTEEKKISIEKANEIENQINQYCEQLRSEHLESIKNNEYSYDTGIIFTDIFSECEKIGNYAINVSEALFESR
ncbi:Na/Pi cotransporter family protein [Plebeiibacterium marinum]|uniref:Na/Pi cotransporter family protein n=1 Tax=Plebeiibacterium marinum TaxID=2992111 RepID=A0AAE3SI73_9BACT|nr:Na/Pi cotransporter family protein [Plebeiobacterium marinum]MCW3804425.1 Na/Pi cotransporter family protein [Plebeiobacterium marinum]